MVASLGGERERQPFNHVAQTASLEGALRAVEDPWRRLAAKRLLASPVLHQVGDQSPATFQRQLRHLPKQSYDAGEQSALVWHLCLWEVCRYDIALRAFASG